MKKVSISFLAIIIIAGASYYYFIGTPRYSLYQAKKSIQNHDSISFNKYVDVDRVVDGMINEVSKSTENEMDSSTNSWNELGKGLVNAMLPSLKDGLKNKINQSVEEISADKQNALLDAKIEEIVQEGKSANVMLINAKDEKIHLRMIQSPERYWKVVGIEFDDFKKISPENIAVGTESQKEDAPINEITFDKNIGDDVELATMKIKINSVNEQQFIKARYSDKKIASEDSKFVVINLTVTNITKESFDFDSDGIRITDDQDRKFDAWDDAIGGIDNYLEVRTLQPGIRETGMMVYEVPSDASSYRMNIGKMGTSEMYSIKLK